MKTIRATVTGGVEIVGKEPWVSVARTLAAEHGVEVLKWRSNMTGIAFHCSNEIEAPQPRSAVSFSIFAHEVGHQVLHNDNGSYPRWREEVEAWDFALEQFKRFGLPGRLKIQRRATRSVAYAFGKATRRGADPRLIHRIYPVWSKRVQTYEGRP